MATNIKFPIPTTTFLVVVVVAVAVAGHLVFAEDNWDEIVNGEVDTSNWINLNDMNVDLRKDGSKPDKKISKQENPGKSQTKIEEAAKDSNPDVGECNGVVATSIEETFTLRRVRQILKLLQVDVAGVDNDVDGNDDVRRFDAKIELTVAQIIQLRKFLTTQGSKQMSHKEHVGRLHDVNDILENLITKAVPEVDLDFSNLAEDYTNKLKYYLPSTQDLFWAILIGGGLGIVYLLWIGLPLWKWFLLILALSSVWHWGHLYKKAMLKKHVALMASSHIPAECFQEKGWWGFISRSNQKCIEYHEALLVDPLWEVTPTMAVAETLFVFVMQPLEQIGLHLGKFFSALVSTQSWLTLVPTLIFCFILIFLLTIMIFRYRVRLPFLMAIIEPHIGPDNQAAIQVQLQE